MERCWSTSLGITTWEAELSSSPCLKPQRGHCPCAESFSGMLLALGGGIRSLVVAPKLWHPKKEVATRRGRPGGHLPGSSRFWLQQLPKKPWRGFGFSSEGKSIFNALSHHPHFLRLSTPATNDPLGAGSTAGTLLEVPLVATGEQKQGQIFGIPARRAPQMGKARVRAIPQPHLRARDLKSEQGKPGGSPRAMRLGRVLWLALFANSDGLETSRARRSPQVPRGPTGGWFWVHG